MPARARFGLSAALLLLTAGLLTAAPTSNYKVAAPVGTSVHQLGEHRVEVTASAPVTVYIHIQGAVVTGTAEAPGEPADVTILLLGDEGEDDTLLFQGRVKALVWFEAVIPHETGHGEG